MPRVTSAAPASSQSGEKPNARIDPSSTMLPAPLRTASFFGDVSNSPAIASGGRSTPPTSSTVIRRRFFAVASYSRERRTRRGRTSSAVSWTAPPTRPRPRGRAARAASEEARGAAHATSSSKAASATLAPIGDPAEHGEAVERERRSIGVVRLAATFTATPPPSAFRFDSTRHPGGHRTAMPPKSECSVEMRARVRAAPRAGRPRYRRTRRASSLRGTPVARLFELRCRRRSRRARPRRSRRRRGRQHALHDGRRAARSGEDADG